ncbi:MAG TPA: hypothetical protein VK966_11300, partial [Longimicrobiales bacterium]|nr:hypothetical protein [Longimicrobiales bacterium]
RLLGPAISDVGDLREAVARRELDVEGQYVHVERDGDADRGVLGPVRRLVVRQGPEPDSPVMWVIRDGAPTRPDEVAPDARP